MKRRIALFFFLTALLGFSESTTLLSQLPSAATVPFPGAIVVLDDPGWKSRARDSGSEEGYLWAAPHQVLYRRPTNKGFQVMSQILPSKRDVPLPSALPQVVLRPRQGMIGLSPNRKTLCIWDEAILGQVNYLLLSLSGKTKPIPLNCEMLTQTHWSPDSRFLLDDDWDRGYVFQRYDLQTGKRTQQRMKGVDFTLDCVTPTGRLLSFSYDRVYAPGSVVTWRVNELKGKKVIPIVFQKKRIVAHVLSMVLSPAGNRLLWENRDEKNVTHWEVSDLEGNERHVIGTLSLSTENAIARTMEGELKPQWTPDGKGVHFIKDNKLMYLAVP